MILSDKTLKDGDVEVTAVFAGIELSQTDSFTTTASIILGHDPQTGSYITAGLGGAGAAFALASYNPTSGWRFLKTYGVFQNLEVDHEYQLQVRLTGKRVALVVDGIEVLIDQFTGSLGSQIGLHAQSHDPVSFSEFTVAGQLPSAFAVMEFSEEFNVLYREVLAPVAASAGLELHRADEISGPGVIIQDIIKDIEEATVIVAEVSSKNPNVFYEIGYADALNKPVVLLARKPQCLFLLTFQENASFCTMILSAESDK
jgi:hypothetical protein